MILANDIVYGINATNPRHFNAHVFVDGNFTGENTIIDINAPILKEPFNDSISSMRLTVNENQSKGYAVEVCEHKSYAGNCMVLGPGDYDIQTLGWLNDQISSIRGLSPNTLELKNVTIGMMMNGSN
ncbi:MAG: beta/gamma crystallin-related protein [Thermoproteota archaeon]|nr:beta/gamma crystallin-related protein [Thermoproteota archaeon]